MEGRAVESRKVVGGWIEHWKGMWIEEGIGWKMEKGGAVKKEEGFGGAWEMSGCGKEDGLGELSDCGIR